VSTLLLLLALPLATAARDAAPSADDPKIEARMLSITGELRCLVCQNQTIADSHSALAEDLRRQVREMLVRGDTDQQVTEYMTARYGDFVLYRPPFKATTALLWFGPGLLLVGASAGLFVVLRRRSRLGPEKFDPDEDADDASVQGGGKRVS
jgi:cytochrome c-type biogenesis protein CcmH